MKSKLQATKLLMLSQGKSLLHPSEELNQVTPLHLIINTSKVMWKKNGYQCIWKAIKYYLLLFPLQML